MAGSLTNIGEELALNLLLRNSGTQPTDIFIGLATNSPSSNPLGEDSVLADVDEVDDLGYAKQEVVFSAPVKIENDISAVENNSQIEFGPWEEDEDIGVNYAFLVDNNDNLIGIFELPSVKEPVSGESLIIVENNCTFGLN